MKKSKSQTQGAEWLYGRHAVEAAITAGKRKIFEILLVEQPKGQLSNLLKGLKVTIITKQEMEQKFPKAVHQGLAAKVSALSLAGVEDLLDKNLVLVLDQVTDPHNLGAILRSADAFGCAGVIVPPARSAPVTDIVAKTACGALETVPLVEANLAQAIQKLQKAGFWAIGLDGASKQTLAKIPRYEKTCLVMGSEGSGLRELVAKQCDHLAKLPMVGTVESLNVSVATGVALYEVSSVQHPSTITNR
ncbi:MAG: 23S rRNA (guanosine(2251)-2'-O)-methyltransferase RlmB [Alphaproteobacteria bacterium]|nr:23S rRNA (guanosine(2251)-2'-O)-methyltransferase RlmB [Alphaproteobacteria bacterium]MDD9920584.1 23S rRNA (guanosine(2251)-2'-O)-methyltransferase RlmB [Alphaproteobacteria bacterium]